MAIDPTSVTILNIPELGQATTIQNDDLLIIGQGIYARKSTILSLYQKFGIQSIIDDVTTLKGQVANLGLIDAVLFSPQVLAAPQQDQARDNISAASIEDILTLRGINLVADQANAIIYVYDGNGVQLASLSVGWLNNEGTTFVYNPTNNTLELWNDQGQLLSSIPVSSFVTNLVSNANWNGTTPSRLDFKDNTGTVLFSIDYTIANIQGLTAALTGKANTTGTYPGLNVGNSEKWNGNSIVSTVTNNISLVMTYDSVTTAWQPADLNGVKTWLGITNTVLKPTLQDVCNNGSSTTTSIAIQGTSFESGKILEGTAFFGFYNWNGIQKKNVAVGGLLASDDYSNLSLIPLNGGYFKGNVVVPDAQSNNHAVNLGQLNNAITSIVIPTVGNGQLSFTAPLGLTITGTFNANQSNNTAISISYSAGFQTYTTAEANKLAGIQAGAEVNVNADWNAVSGDQQILNKPTSFPPAAHTHPISQVINLQNVLDGLLEKTGIIQITDFDLAPLGRTYATPTTLNSPDGTYGELVTTESAGWLFQTFRSVPGKIFIRKNINSIGYDNWVEIFTTSNFNPANYALLSQVYTQAQALGLFVGLNGVQTIADTKTFSSSPIVPNATLNGHTVNLGQLNTILTAYAPKSAIPLNVSQLTNDVGYITASSLPTVGNGNLSFSVSSDFTGGAFSFSANQSGNVTPTSLSLSTTIKDNIDKGVAASDYLGSINSPYKEHKVNSNDSVPTIGNMFNLVYSGGNVVTNVAIENHDYNGAKLVVQGPSTSGSSAFAINGIDTNDTPFSSITVEAGKATEFVWSEDRWRIVKQ